MAARKAAKVLPDPVGAAISTFRPCLICGQASPCAGVGEAKVFSNQLVTAGWKRRARSMQGEYKVNAVAFHPNSRDYPLAWIRARTLSRAPTRSASDT